jgi:hypothetical protein
MNRQAAIEKLVERYLSSKRLAWIGEREERLKRLVELGDPEAGRELGREEVRHQEMTPETMELVTKALAGDVAAFEDLAFGPPNEEMDRGLRYLTTKLPTPYEMITERFVSWMQESIRDTLKLASRVQRGQDGSTVTFKVNPFRWLGFKEKDLYNWILSVKPHLRRSTTSRSITRAAKALLRSGLRIVVTLHWSVPKLAFWVNVDVEGTTYNTSEMSHEWVNVLGRWDTYMGASAPDQRTIYNAMVRWQNDSVWPFLVSIKNGKRNARKWYWMQTIAPLIDVQVEEPVEYIPSYQSRYGGEMGRLRRAVIRLAHEKPELRRDLLDLLVEAANGRTSARRRVAPRKVRRAPVDSIVTFEHEGEQVVAQVINTRWRGPKEPMLYVWMTSSGREITTEGLPPDTEVVKRR